MAPEPNQLVKQDITCWRAMDLIPFRIGERQNQCSFLGEGTVASFSNSSRRLPCAGSTTEEVILLFGVHPGLDERAPARV